MALSVSPITHQNAHIHADDKIGRKPPFSIRFSVVENKHVFGSSSSPYENSVVEAAEEQAAMTGSREGQAPNACDTTDICTIHVDSKYWSYKCLRPSSDIQAFLEKDLDVSRLNVVYDALWWAGRQVPPRPLHRLKMLGRNITITEQADLHLVWSREFFYVKPLPGFLLDYTFWEQNICHDEHSQDVYESARGFVLSYVWLVRHKSDFEIAKDEWLLPAELTWPMWTEFVESVWDSFGDLDNPPSISRRYKYGELRVARLDQIYRFAPGLFPQNLLQGYLYSYSSYGGFFRREFAWLIVAFAYVSTILSAMQVGLTTTQLKDNNDFNRASYGFTVVSILFPALASLIAIVFYTGLWMYHVLFTVSSWRRAEKMYKSRRTSINTRA